MKDSVGGRIAAVVYAVHGEADAVLADFAFGLRRQGRRVRGVVQQPGAESGRMVLVDLDGGRCFPLFQNLGSGSGSCSLDSGGVAEASVALRRALAEGADLVVANRFGALEAAGGGFAAEMLALISEEVPLLTAVAEKHLTAWRDFTGGGATELPPSLAALEEWFTGLERSASREISSGKAEETSP